MFFTKLVVEAVMVFLVSKWGQEFGNSCYEVFRGILEYVLFSAETGYFKDHPEDKKRKNSVANICHRITVVIKEKKAEGAVK